MSRKSPSTLAKALTLASVTLSLSIYLTAAQGASLVGKTNANFAVVQGAATYSIPVTVPKGVNDLTPQLSLNYHSRSGNGIIGVGWQLGGLQAITRCQRHIRHAGVRNSPRQCSLTSMTYSASTATNS